MLNLNFILHLRKGLITNHFKLSKVWGEGRYKYKIWFIKGVLGRNYLEKYLRFIKENTNGLKGFGLSNPKAQSCWFDKTLKNVVDLSLSSLWNIFNVCHQFSSFFFFLSSFCFLFALFLFLSDRKKNKKQTHLLHYLFACSMWQDLPSP